MRFHNKLNKYLIMYCLLSLAISQHPDPAILTVERIYDSEEFSKEELGKIIWSIDNNSYLKTEDHLIFEKGVNIYRHDIESGDKEIIVPAEKLIPLGASTPLVIDEFEFSKDEKKLLIYTNSKKVWRRNTRGDYWLLDLENWKLEKLGGMVDSSSMMFANFSPDGK